MSEAEGTSRDDEKVQISDKARAKKSKHQKGKASRPVGVLSLLRLDSETHKTCRGNTSTKMKTRAPVESKQTHRHPCVSNV